MEREPSPSSGEDRPDRPDFRTRGPVRHYSRTVSTNEPEQRGDGTSGHPRWCDGCDGFLPHQETVEETCTRQDQRGRLPPARGRAGAPGWPKRPRRSGGGTPAAQGGTSGTQGGTSAAQGGTSAARGRGLRQSPSPTTTRGTSTTPTATARSCNTAACGSARPPSRGSSTGTRSGPQEQQVGSPVSALDKRKKCS